jgi:type II secretory pathway pseudopilin PulG
MLRRTMESPGRRPGAAGFTMVELLVTLTILSAVLVVLGTVMLSASRSRTATGNQVEAVSAARAGADIMARDLRSAGYGVDMDYATLPQPAIAYVDSTQILINANMTPYPDTAAVRIGPHAYNPTGTPRPFPLNGTAYQPPIKYRSGAEVIQWTLDVNNDGQVNSSDVGTSGDGLDAYRTANPDDYMLLRRVYGDSCGATPTSGNNGGTGGQYLNSSLIPPRVIPTTERIALVRKPGGTVPALFTVYLRGSSTPWPWSAGPVPATRLAEIERIVMNITATSAKPDWRGKYAETQIRTEINSLRNSPNFDLTQYALSGYVYHDLNKNKAKDSGEPGLSGARVTCGALALATDATGFYRFVLPPGTYTLKHTPPMGYGVLTAPDSFNVTLGPAATRSFADTARAGGTVNVYVFNDADKSGAKSGSENWKPGARVFLQGDTLTSVYTNGDGYAALFAPVGGYKVVMATPDSFTASTPTFYTGTMTNGGSATHTFGVYMSASGTVSGKVFVDNDRNGSWDTREPVVRDAWVGIGPADSPVMAYTMTDNTGSYSIEVPVNDPPHTTPYYVQCIPPSGYAAASTLVRGPLWVSDHAVISNQDFSLGTFYIIRAEAQRVLSLASGDLVEKDWGLSLTTTPRQDVDIVLGAEASGVDNVMVWFNQYDAKPLLNPVPSYSRDAAQSVLSLALDSLDTAGLRRRLDVVAGTKYTTRGNLYSWLTQNTSDNEGYLPKKETQAMKTADLGDVTVVKTRQMYGGAGPEILAGTKSPTAGYGTLEIWANNDANPPVFSRLAQYPPGGGIPSNRLGEVTSLDWTDVDADGMPDLVVGTKKSNYTGQVMIFELMSSGLVWRNTIDFTGDAVTAVTTLDIDADGQEDIVAGTESGLTTGRVIWLRNRHSASFPYKFDVQSTKNAPGIIQTMTSGDLGGTTREDILIGWRSSSTGYGGGVQIWYTDAKNLPDSGVDPSGGTVANMVTGITLNNFDFGTYPTTPPMPYLMDFAVGVKKNAIEGELVVFVR